MLSKEAKPVWFAIDNRNEYREYVWCSVDIQNTNFED